MHRQAPKAPSFGILKQTPPGRNRPARLSPGRFHTAWPLKGPCWLDVRTAQEELENPAVALSSSSLWLMLLYERMNRSSSDAAQVITSLTDLPDCVNWASIF